MGCQFDAVWTTRGVKLHVRMHILVTEEVAYGSDGSTLFSPGKVFHLTGISYNYDNGVVEVAISSSLKDWLSLGRPGKHLEGGKFRLISKPRA